MKQRMNKTAHRKNGIFRVIFAVIACFIFWIAAPALHAAESPQFFSSIPDMPLMTGLKELTDQTVVFDKPEGRIIESVALIESQPEEAVIRFYKDTLPQLGWARIGNLSFQREDEFLRVSIENFEGRKFLRLAIAPAAS
jgi:hypothetical protein